MSNTETDICIVGSGIAGMLLAERLHARGRQVLLVERGTAMTFEERLRRKSHDDPLPFNRGPFFYPHEPQPVGPRGRGRQYVYQPVYNLGGATNHFFGNVPRMHPAHFHADAFGGVNRRWPIAYEDVEPYYLEAERRLNIAGNSERTPFPGKFAYPLPPHRLSPSDRACETVFGAAHVMQVPTVRPSREVDGRPQCCGSNLCDLCPVDSKGTALNMVYPSIRDRVPLQSGWLATEVRCQRGRVTSVRAIDATGHAHDLHARQFILASNGIDSPLLLLRSPQVPQHPSLGRHYMDHPVFDLVVYGTGLDAKPGYGDSAQTGMVTAFFEKLSDDLPVSLLGEIRHSTLASNPGEGNRDEVLRGLVERALQPGDGRAGTFRERFHAEFNQVLDVWFLLESLPLGESRVSIQRIEKSGQAIADISIPYPTYLPRAIEQVTARIQRRLPNAEIRLLSTYPCSHHWLGATRMADSAAEGCVDRDLRYHGLDNLFVLSGSVFPSCSSANPTLTIAALALRLGDHLAPPGV